MRCKRIILYFLMCASLTSIFLSSGCGSGEKDASDVIANTNVRHREARFYYSNELVRSDQKIVLLNDHPEYVQPLEQDTYLNAPMLLNDPDADIFVKACRFSYNARDVIVTPNAISGKNTAIIVVHPWGVDDDQNYNSPDPYGVALFCTPEKNAIYHQHLKNVVMPFIESMKGIVKFTGYSLPGHEDEIRKHMYRSIDNNDIDPAKGRDKFNELLKNKNLTGGSLKVNLNLPGGGQTFLEYFNTFSGLDSSQRYNGSFWEVPMPLASSVKPGENDFVIYDADGYEKLRDYLKKEGIYNILLCGYATDMCVISTTAGYNNLRQDFNVFIVGDAGLATFPGQETPAYATSAALAFASLNNFITQISWIKEIKN